MQQFTCSALGEWLAFMLTTLKLGFKLQLTFHAVYKGTCNLRTPELGRRKGLVTLQRPLPYWRCQIANNRSINNNYECECQWRMQTIGMPVTGHPSTKAETTAWQMTNNDNRDARDWASLDKGRDHCLTEWRLIIWMPMPMTNADNRDAREWASLDKGRDHCLTEWRLIIWMPMPMTNADNRDAREWASLDKGRDDCLTDWRIIILIMNMNANAMQTIGMPVFCQWLGIPRQGQRPLADSMTMFCVGHV